jgi:hypothetical protein
MLAPYVRVTRYRVESAVTTTKRRTQCDPGGRGKIKDEVSGRVNSWRWAGKWVFPETAGRERGCRSLQRGGGCCLSKVEAARMLFPGSAQEHQAILLVQAQHPKVVVL